MKKTVLAFAAALLVTTAESAQTAPVVAIQQGRLSGEVLASGTRVFRGIPYAQPPIGTLRWKAPVPAAKWNGLRDATVGGAACVQPPTPAASIYLDTPPKMSEDCLFLNVWTPKAAKSAPVLVWIHGGSLVSGYGSSPVYDGAKLASRGAVVVSINYRLGILGYLAHPGLSAESPDHVSGNYGLLDQIEALRWVKANIVEFGGDPANITIVGESAGGLSVSALMASPLSRDLFEKAIAESSYLVSSPALSTTTFGTPPAEKTGTMVSAAFKAPDVASLRAISAETLVNTSARLGYAPWLTIDGHALTKQLVETFDAGEQSRVPLLTGFNSGEIRTLRFLAPSIPADAATYEKKIRANYRGLAPDYLRLYPSKDIEGNVLAATRDGIYGWTAQHMAVKQTAIGVPAYLYYFDHGYPAADTRNIHGFHAAEVPYVFGQVGAGNALPKNWPAPPATPAEVGLSEAMMDYWTSFARTGAPVAKGQPKWAPYAKGAAYLEIGDRPIARTNLLPGTYTLHDDVICRRRAAGQPWLANIGVAAGTIPAAACPSLAKPGK